MNNLNLEVLKVPLGFIRLVELVIFVVLSFLLMFSTEYGFASLHNSRQFLFFILAIGSIKFQNPCPLGVGAFANTIDCTLCSKRFQNTRRCTKCFLAFRSDRVCFDVWMGNEVHIQLHLST